MENNVLYFNLYTILLCFWATKAWFSPNSARHIQVQPKGRDVAVEVHLIAHKLNRMCWVGFWRLCLKTAQVIQIT